MKKFKLFLISMLALVGMFATSCSGSGNDKEQQEAHNEVSAIKLHELLAYWDSNPNVNYQIIDYRSQAAYNAGHMKGAAWVMEGTNTTMGNGSFANAVKAKVNGNTKTVIVLVGSAQANLMMTLAGSVSSAGFGKAHTYILLGGYDAWVAAYPNEVE